MHNLPPKSLVVTAEKALNEPLAQRLSHSLHIPKVAPEEAQKHPWVLICGDESLKLRFPGATQPFSVDFNATAYLRRLQQATCAREPLARAAGLKTGSAVHVVDGTVGWGSDAFLLAKLGAQVTAIERSPIVAALLADGLSRALKLPLYQHLKIQLHQADTATFLSQMPEKPDVVYLDPMFPERPHHALVKKPLQLLQQLLDYPSEEDLHILVAAAFQYARQRVVIKRPTWAEPLFKNPSFSISAGIVRFDGYLI